MITVFQGYGATPTREGISRTLVYLSLPVLTFGLFARIINTSTLWLSAAMVKDFDIENFCSALLASLLMSQMDIVGCILFHWLMMSEVHEMMHRSGPVF